MPRANASSARYYPLCVQPSDRAMGTMNGNTRGPTLAQVLHTLPNFALFVEGWVEKPSYITPGFRTPFAQEQVERAAQWATLQAEASLLQPCMPPAEGHQAM